MASNHVAFLLAHLTSVALSCPGRNSHWLGERTSHVADADPARSICHACVMFQTFRRYILPPLSGSKQGLRPQNVFIKYILTCLPVAKHWLGKYIPAIQAHAVIEGYPLLGNEPVNMVFSVGSIPRSYRGTQNARRSSKRHGVYNNSRIGVAWNIEQ